MSAVTAVGMAAVPSCCPQGGASSKPLHSSVPIDEKLLPLYHGAAQDPALLRRYPWLRFGDKPEGHVQIAPIAALPDAMVCDASSGMLGERIMRAASGATAIPWAPMFRRPTPVYQAGAGIAPAGAGRLFVKDEGSDESLLFGNKIRKYEFLLPNLACSGVGTIRTHGAYGSNHCAYLTLAARYGRYGRHGAPGGIDAELFLYPQELSDNVLTKLRLLVASGAKLHFLDGDASVGLSIVGEEVRVRSFGESTVGYIGPGGSSPLSVLGHVEAVMELAEQIESGGSPLDSPPAYIFVPLGSGATAMGLVLGCYLLGWGTTVVGTCSQDKGRVARLAVNGDADTPFLLANAASLLDKSLKWVTAMGLAKKGATPTAQQLLRRYFVCDSETWHPAYGKVTPEIAREAATAAEAGLMLDNTFTAKSFHTMNEFARGGGLSGKTSLFWNTYQRFPLEKILPEDEKWRFALPDGLRERVEAYMRGKRGRTA